RRPDRRGHRPSDSLFGTLPDGIPDSDIRLVRDRGHPGVVIRRRDLRNRPCDEGGQARSGGEFEVRMKTLLASASSVSDIGWPESRSQELEAPANTKTPGRFARLILVTHLAGIRLGSEVPADFLHSRGY